ncbi:MAG: 30S ribosomal protein S3 [Nanoarchaeota archaeon]|nr:30S ribosomal protein S3 [Nanoarchaeota archaeon]|tara:strand:+ start:3021 stop:3962 length:942 start_codon:yes stop_codon:yes gene_type:complete
MMEREFINQKTKEWHIKNYIEKRLKRVELSQIRLKKIPLGEKIIIQTSRPSLVVGSKGANIRDLTKELKKHFKLENPQIEIVEVKDIFLDPKVVADRMVSMLERYGSQRFKGVGHRMMDNIMRAGALGVEIIMSGKIPGSRAKSWRFYQGYLKKCGDIAITGVRTAHRSALLKSGIIGIKVKIMPPNIVLPDRIEIIGPAVEEVQEEKVEITQDTSEAEEVEAIRSAEVKPTQEGKAETTEEQPSAETSEEVAKESEVVPEENTEPIAEEQPAEESEEPAKETEAPAEEEASEEEPVPAEETVEEEKTEESNE